MPFICHGKLTWQYMPCKALCKGHSEVSPTPLETFRGSLCLSVDRRHQKKQSSAWCSVIFWQKKKIISIFEQLLAKTWWSLIAVHCQLMASFVKLLILCCQNNKESGCTVICAGKFFSALQTSASVICWYCIEVVLQAGCGKLHWNTYFHSSSAQWRDGLFSCTDKVCESHPRLVDLSWPMHQRCSKTFSCVGSQVWGVWTWEVWCVWARQYLTLASLCELLARNVLHGECKWRGSTQNRTSYQVHRVTALCSRPLSMQLTPELCCNIALVFRLKDFSP